MFKLLVGSTLLAALLVVLVPTPSAQIIGGGGGTPAVATLSPGTFQAGTWTYDGAAGSMNFTIKAGTAQSGNPLTVQFTQAVANDNWSINASGSIGGRTNAGIKILLVPASPSIRMSSDACLQYNSTSDLGGGAIDTELCRGGADWLKPATGDAFGITSKGWISTAPSSPTACSSPSVTWSNGTAAFQIDVGTSCAGISTLVVTLPAVSNAYSCTAMNVTTSATAAVEMTASTTTNATFTNYTRTTGASLVWVDGADVRVSCTGG